METLCCTTRYRKLFGLPNQLPAADESPAANGSALGPWYANVMNIGSLRLLHYMSSTSLLSVVIWQREKRSAEQRFVQMLGDVLTALGAAPAIVASELALAADIAYARATSRSVLASMRDQMNGARWQLSRTRDLLEVSLELAQTPCGPMDYASPRKVAPRLLAEHWSTPRHADE